LHWVGARWRLGNLEKKKAFDHKELSSRQDKSFSRKDESQQIAMW